MPNTPEPFLHTREMGELLHKQTAEFVAKHAELMGADGHCPKCIEFALLSHALHIVGERAPSPEAFLYVVTNCITQATGMEFSNVTIVQDGDAAPEDTLH